MQMTVVSETDVATAAPLATRAARGRCLFLYPQSRQPCGVEIFTSTLVTALKSSVPDGGYDLLPVSGRWRDLPSLLHRIARVEQIVFSFPLVAWKRVLVLPLVLLLFALATRRRISTLLHEWEGLHGLRRLVVMPIVLASHTILVLSPFIRAQIANDRWLRRVAQRCRLLPHPPTVRRPAMLTVTERVRAVADAAAGRDIVIGYFGAIYDGKAPDALLDICDNVRSRGLRPLVVFIGDFTKSLDDYEARFRAKIAQMGLDDQVIVTGYVAGTDELFALFERMDVFLFLFPEGLTARRSSVIACLQSNRPVVVSAPKSLDEFSHHEGFKILIADGALSFVPPAAAIDEITDRLLAAAKQRPNGRQAIDGDAWWDAAIAATRAAL
jgi:glycosyltransferase involved in cell wall biosynthesis